ncbi:MAG: hypothetical protein RBT34_03915 [Anaerolineaceae bacterium]|jgi:hypothetical protein|nr:hypothetical protein [Anaerolineaceae bacterium]
MSSFTPSSQNPTRPRWLSLIGVLLIAAHSLYAAGLFTTEMLDLRASKQPGQDDPALWAERLGRLPEVLPGSGLVGYFSDRDLAGISDFDAFQETLEFIWTQYALAPHILTRSLDEDLVIGNLTAPLNEEDAAELGLTLKEDLGQRIYLYTGGGR